MKQCAYCDKTDEKITKEHVVNKAFIDRYYKIGKGYANAYDKYTENYLTAKDVCGKCNNEILSRLDDYFLDFYEANIPSFTVDKSSTFLINYEFERLSKWLLKTLYNSERKNAYEHIPQKMSRFKSYILGKDNRTKLFRIYIELLQDVSKEVILQHSHVKEEEIPEKLNFLRLGNIVFTDQFKTGVSDTIKYFISANFMFHIFILDVGKHSDKIFRITFDQYKNMLKTTKLYYLNSRNSEIKVSASHRTIINVLENTFEGNKHVTARMKE